MVVNLLLAALQGAPIARRMQVPESDSDCVTAAQNFFDEDCTPESTAMNCMNEQLAPKCQKMIDYDYSAFSTVQTCAEYYVALSANSQVLAECMQEMLGDIVSGGGLGRNDVHEVAVRRESDSREETRSVVRRVVKGVARGDGAARDGVGRDGLLAGNLRVGSSGRAGEHVERRGHGEAVALEPRLPRVDASDAEQRVEGPAGGVKGC